MTGDFEARRKGINPTRNVVHWTDSSPSFVQSSENSWGIFHYAVNDLFNASKRGVDDGTPARCSIIVSYLEIYNERIIDLLAGEPISACGVAKRGDREGSVNGVVVKSAMVSNINNQTSNSVLSNTRRRNSSASSGNSSLSSAQGRNISVYDFRGNSSADKSTSLDIAEDPKTGQTYVVGLSEVEIHNVEQLNDLLEEGTRRRTKASTASNVASSRSHAILQLTYREERGVFQESCDNAHDYKPSSASPAHRTRGVCHNEENGDITSTGSPSILWGRLSLIDLAGSEREHYIIPSSGSQRSKRRTQQQEGANINKSLLALGNCITTLGQQSARIMASQQSAVLTGSNSHESAAGSIHNTNNKTGSQSRQRQVSSSIAALQQHIPYRDSKLTRLLKDSLGGNTQTLMIATISPACITHEETLSTLKYATRAKAITQSVEKNLLTGAQAIKELHAAKEKRRKLKLENEEKERAEKLALQEREEEKKCLNELKMYNQQKLRQKEQEIRQNKVHCGRERKRAYEEDSDQFTVIKDPSNLSVMSELNMHADTEKPNAMAGITVVGKWESYNNNDNSNKNIILQIL